MVAMFYGYDIKNNPSELVIAGDVFKNALSPGIHGLNGSTDYIEKIMFMTEITVVKQLSKKTWKEMAEHGGIALLMCQMRALANKAAKKGLEKAGKKGLEQSILKGVFEQIGKNLTKKSLSKAMPVAGAAIGALIDTAQMNIVLEYADVFYHKRYLIEKEARINTLISGTDFIYEDYTEIIEEVVVDGV